MKLIRNNECEVHLSFGEAANLYKIASEMLRPVSLNGGTPSLTEIFSNKAQNTKIGWENRIDEKYLEITLNSIAHLVSEVEAASQNGPQPENSLPKDAIRATLSDWERFSTFPHTETIIGSFLKTQKVLQSLKTNGDDVITFVVDEPSVQRTLKNFVTKNPVKAAVTAYNSHAFRKRGINAYSK